MMKEGSENKPALLILLIYLKKSQKSNLSFNWNNELNMWENLIMK